MPNDFLKFEMRSLLGSVRKPQYQLAALRARHLDPRKGRDSFPASYRSLG